MCSLCTYFSEISHKFAQRPRTDAICQKANKISGEILSVGIQDPSVSTSKLRANEVLALPTGKKRQRLG